ncbi:MAG: phytanoyl-CoA dioxygenase family protein [Deltaproteobacteria bacterium]|nr:phytanoyl-CoA dioxygenase family protein [Deltaproteobacteria bacterium]
MIQAHPLNQGFEWAPTRGPFRRVTAAQAWQYDHAGYFVLEDALDAATRAALLAAIDPIEAEVEAMVRACEGGRLFIARAGEITFSPHLVTRSALLREFCAGRLFQDLTHDLIGPDVRLYWDQAVYKKPDVEADFPWHQDNGYTYVEPQRYLTCWIALTDATPDNGCPWVTPGLHRGTLRHWMTELGWRCLDDAPDAMPVPARAGSIVVFSSLTPHRTGPNRTAATRKSYIVQFAPDGARVIQRGADGDLKEQLCDAPERQFVVLRDGQSPQMNTENH